MLQQLAEPLLRLLALADGHQAAGDIAHHVMQKGIGLDVDMDEFAVTLHAQILDLADRRFGLAAGGAEAAEIVFADQ